MLGRLHFMGTKIVNQLSEATQVQHAFLQMACVEYVNEEREFQANIHGVKLQKHSSDVRDAGKKALKDPRKLKRKEVGS